VRTVTGLIKIRSRFSPLSLTNQYKNAQERSEESNNVAGGGVKSSLVEGLVNGSAEPVQKHPHPEGQIGTDNSNDLQHEMWVTCEQLRHVLERPR
jgi:hypothetical protein